MQVLIGLAALACMAALVLGIILPRWVLPARLRPSRWKALGIYSALVGALFTLHESLMTPEALAARDAERQREVAEWNETKRRQAEEEAAKRADPEFQRQAVLANVPKADRAIKAVEVTGEVLHVTIDPGMTFDVSGYLPALTGPMLKAAKAASEYPAVANYIRFIGNAEVTDRYGRVATETVVRLQMPMVDATKINYKDIDRLLFINLVSIVSEQKGFGVSREYCAKHADDSRYFCERAAKR